MINNQQDCTIMNSMIFKIYHRSTLWAFIYNIFAWSYAVAMCLIYVTCKHTFKIFKIYLIFNCHSSLPCCFFLYRSCLLYNNKDHQSISYILYLNKLMQLKLSYGGTYFYHPLTTMLRNNLWVFELSNSTHL